MEVTDARIGDVVIAACFAFETKHVILSLSVDLLH